MPEVPHHSLSNPEDLFFEEESLNAQKVFSWFHTALTLSEGERQKQLYDALHFTFHHSFDAFFGMLESLAGVNILDGILTVKAKSESIPKEKVVLTPEEHLLPLEIDAEIFFIALKIAQKDPTKFEKFKEFLGIKIPNPQIPHDGTEFLDLTGAGLPSLFPRINRYVDEMGSYLDTPQRKKHVFIPLTQALQVISRRVFGSDSTAYATRGTGASWDKHVLHYLNIAPQSSFVVTPPMEYFPMVNKLPEGRHEMLDNMPEDIDEETLVKNLVELAEQRIQSIPEDQKNMVEIPLHISSITRFGRYFSVPKLVEAVTAANKKAGRKKYHLWIDAAQDSRTNIQGADIVWFSKRFAKSGGGLAVVNNKTYPGGESPDTMRWGFYDQSGFNLSVFSQVIASLYCTDQRMGHSFAELLTNIPLWNFQGKGGYLQEEIKKAREYIAQSQVLNGVISFSAPDMERDVGHNFRIDAVMNIRFAEREAFERVLTGLETQEMAMDNFSLRNDSHIQEIQAMFDDPESSPEAIQAALKAFQKNYGDQLIRAITPFSNGHEKDELQTYLHDAITAHDLLRLYITGVNRPDFLLDTIKRIEGILTPVRGEA